ncbi:MAG: twin-arginine translocation signal domain-containing protein [Lachnospiraceae bacterium]|nr:twin-arginine translocation signal domain-containing protein [Lachnospiraceae bacterium]
MTRRISRRDFLKGSAAGAASLAFASMFYGAGQGKALAAENAAADGGFAAAMEAKFATDALPMQDRPQVRWWLDEAYHTDETLQEAVQNLYGQGIGGVELLCLNDSSLDNSLYGWGTEEWQHDLQVVAEVFGKLGMSVCFAAGRDWQPSFLYYGTNADVAGNSSWEDYYEDYQVLRDNGRDVLEMAYASGEYNVYQDDDGTLTIDPNVDVFNQGIIVGDAVCAAAGETVSIDLTSFTYEAQQSGAPGGGDAAGAAPEGDGAAEGASEGDAAAAGTAAGDVMAAEGETETAESESQAELMGTSVSRTKYTVGFENLQAVTISQIVEQDASFERTTIGTYATSTSETTGGMKLSAEGVEQFTEEELSVDGLVSYDESTGTYTLTWTNPYDFDVALIPAWKIGVGHGTAADTYDYGNMLMGNHFSNAGGDAWYAFLKTYILTDEMMEIIEKYDIRWDLFIDSLEISSLGRFFWSNEVPEVFYNLKGYDVTPYLPALFSTDYSFDDIDNIENDMRDALTEAYIIFKERLSENLK